MQLVEPTPSTRKRTRVERNLWRRTKDGQLEAIYTGPDGKQHLKVLGTKSVTEARKQLRDLLGQVDRGEAIAPSKLTFAEVAAEYVTKLEGLVGSGRIAPRTLEGYRSTLDLHTLPALGHLHVQKITPNHLSAFFKKKQAEGLSENYRLAIKTPLSKVLKHAIRRGYIARNPLVVLESDELPRAQAKRESRVLCKEEIQKLLDHAPDNYKTLLATAALTGMRLMEILGLTWGDVDLEHNVIRVRAQLSRAKKGEPARRMPLKTNAGTRNIELEPGLRASLLKHKLASSFTRDDDYVFCTEHGTPHYYRNVCVRGLEKAANRAGLNPEGVPSLVFHDLRKTYGSHLIRRGLDVVRVSKRMGHAKPSITLDIYAKEIEGVGHTDDVTEKLTAAFGGLTW